eukprot:TRINITY_DN5906_c0_g1_i1.p1 TRINITY_DN5906_c0_g1~~TRINITY_DN5906_c0_g1_i1.p1  ORF type:complete len:378 (-),score=68.05 TRINITY_DN5906_c0_g1_i1:105-1238(-)
MNIEKLLESYRPRIRETFARCIPRKFTVESLNHILGEAHYAYDPSTTTSALSDPIYAILDRGGKGWRSVLLLLIAEALGGKEEDVIDLCCISEIVHNGTLVVDDIEDNSTTRRGKPCLHLIYPLDVSINAGNAMYFLPLVVLRDRKGKVPDKVLLKCYELYGEEMAKLHVGQGLDIIWHQSQNYSKEKRVEVKDPSVDQYLQMCAFKTGTLARMSVLLAAYLCNAEDSQAKALGRFAEAIGVAFQIQDDILNIVGEEKFTAGKGGAGEDIHEGKRTLMVIHALENSPKADRLREILDSHPTDQKIIDEAISILVECGSVEFSKKYAKKIIEDAWNDENTTIKEGEKKDILKSFPVFLITREIWEWVLKKKNIKLEVF